jgi:P27 family predicted phage terminase small subunit
MKGRKPLPSEIKLLTGSRQPINKREPKPSRTMPTCPKFLQGEARAEWRRISRELHRIGVLTVVDRAALAAYCLAWATMVKATEQLETKEMVIERAFGNLVQNPWLQVRNRAMDDMKRFAVEFGMTPSSRSRVVSNAPKEKSEFEIYLERKNRLAEQQERAA